MQLLTPPPYHTKSLKISVEIIFIRRNARYSGCQKFGIWVWFFFLLSYSFLPVFIIAFMSQVTIFKMFGIKSMIFGKILADNQDLCGISESGNNYFGPFTTHFFTNSCLYSICCNVCTRVSQMYCKSGCSFSH